MNMEALINLPEFYSLKGATEAQIHLLEKKLSLKFSKEYRNLLSLYGCVSVNGHEIVGFSSSKRIDVITVTNEEKAKNKYVPDNFYVLEKVGIDDIVVWQESEGNIYLSYKNNKPELICCDSIVDYLLKHN